VHPIYCEHKFSMMRFYTDFETRIVGNSDEEGCLNANSPSSTASPPISSSTGGALTTSSPSNTPSGSQTVVAPIPDNGDSHGTTGAAIGGVIAGSIVTLVAITTLCMFLYKRRKSKGDPAPTYFPSGKRGVRRVDSVDLAAAPSNDPDSPPVYPPQPGHSPQRQYEYSITPYSPFSGGGYSNTAPSSYGGDESVTYHRNLSSHDHGSTSPRSEQYSRSRGTSIVSKAAMAGMSASGYYPTPRFVVHTDGGTMEEVGEEVVELPPTYNDVNKGTAPNTPTATTQDRSPTFDMHSYSGGASTADAESHPLAPSPTTPNRGKPSIPPVLPPLSHQRDDLDSYDFGNGLVIGSRSSPQSPRGTRHTQPQHEYPFSSPSAQSGSGLQGPLSPR
jgi:hypothetical protein